MKKKNIFSIIFPAFLLIIFISIILITLIFSNVIYSSYIIAVKDKLHSNAFSMSSVVSQKILRNNQKELQNFTLAISEKTGLHITVYSNNGFVIADSDSKSLDPKNQVNATEENPFSNDDTLFFNLPLTNNNLPIGILRVSKNINDINSRIYASYIHIACVGLAVAGLAVILAFFNAKTITEPLEKLKTNASLIINNKNKFTAINSNIVEISELSESLSTMNSRLQDRIDEISEQKNKLNIILANMREGLIAVDHDYNIITMNSAAKKILHIDLQSEKLNDSEHLNTPHRNYDEIAKKNTLSFRNTVKNEQLLLFTEELLKNKSFLNKRVNLPLDNCSRIIDLNGVALKNYSDKSVGALIVINDVTKLTELEEMRKNFAANVSHELKTPLTVIKGAVETLLDDESASPETSKKFLKIIRKHCDRLTKLINDTMSISKIERVNALMEPVESFKLLKLIQHAIELFNEQTNPKKIKIEISCDDSIILKANFNLLEQALLNLIDNALKFTPEYGVVFVSAIVEQNSVAISVKDNGSGIPSEHLPHIFERFYRIDKGRSRQDGGTGLGLAIVKHIAQVHNGSVSVHSIPNVETIFSFNIPLS